jgi:hypothetical protein
MKKPHFYQTKAHKKLETRIRIRTSAMAIGVLKLLDEGIYPLLNIRCHDIHQHPLLRLVHHRL